MNTVIAINLNVLYCGVIIIVILGTFNKRKTLCWIKSLYTVVCLMYMLYEEKNIERRIQYYLKNVFHLLFLVDNYKSFNGFQISIIKNNEQLMNTKIVIGILTILHVIFFMNGSFKRTK